MTEVPVEVYTNLIDAVHGNLDKMYRYVELRKKILGVDELHMYDVYTPIVADADVEISFEEAKKTAFEALAVLGKDYTDVLEEAFSNRWLDVYENTGKRGGAYCTGNGPTCCSTTRITSTACSPSRTRWATPCIRGTPANISR